jgi:hypothetical protein
MTEPEPIGKTWTCPHGIVTGFFRVPGAPHLIEHRSCGICCEEISEKLSPGADVAAGKP